MAAFNVIANMNVWAEASQKRVVSVPGFGTLPYADGVPRPVGTIREQVPGQEIRFDDGDRGWPRADGELVEQVIEWAGPYGEFPVTVFASRNRALNTNTFQLAAVLGHHTLIPIGQLAAEPDDSIANYVDQLSDPATGPPSVLITMSTNAGDFPPTVTQAFAEAAARRTGFRLAGAKRLPDGRLMRIWRRQDS